jgi:muramoyltetrapeptide carboxypeptidase
MATISPPFLKPGSLIRIVSPAGKCEAEPLLGVAEWLRSSGYRADWGKYATSRYYQFAGSDGERLADLQEALDDPSVNAILCSRGGYGTIRLLEYLDFSGFMKYPKWVTGYSDITLLLCALDRLGYCSVHGAMCRHSLIETSHPNESFLSLVALLTGEKNTSVWKGNLLNRPGKTTAPLTGGNLSLLYSLTGTRFDIDTSGKILFIEEIGEYLYHLDRMMVSLRLAGKLEKLAGLVAGYFTDMKDNDDPFGKEYREIILDAVRDYSYPVAFGFPAGHEQPNLPLICGGIYTLEAGNENSSLTTERG